MILRNPDAEGGSGGGVAVEPKVEAKPPVVESKPVVEAKAESKGKIVSDEEYAELATLRAERHERLKAEQKAAEDKLREKGEYEKIVKAREKERDDALARSLELETRTKRSVLTRDLATALSGQPLVKGAASQLLKLWSDEFEVNAEGDEWRTQTRDRKSPEEFVRERLASEEFSHFVLAEARGGAGGGGSKPNPADPNKEPSYLDKVAANLAAMQANQNGRGLATHRQQ